MRTKTLVMERSRTENTWLGIPGIERTPGGRLYVCWFSGGAKEPAPENCIYLQISDDDGQTFSKPMLVVDIPGATRVYDPTLWYDPEWRLWLIYNQSNLDTAEHGVQASICEDADADKPRWGKSFAVGYGVPFSFRVNKPTVINNGDWLMPVTWSREQIAGWFPSGAELQGVGISVDMGQTWQLYGDVKAPAWALENMVIEREDSSLVMYIRTGGGCLWRSVSFDQGRSWSDGEPTEIVNPGTRFFIRKLRSGRWLLINSPDPKQRTGIVACLSEDEGRTWSKPLVLDERPEVSYPDAVQAPDGTIYAVHDRERHKAMEVLLSVFKEEDILQA